MELVNRLIAPTPPFFVKVRNIGLILTALAAAVIGLPLQLPSIVGEVAQVLAVAGSIMTGVSQAAVKNE
ncbi:hypothetical protein SAMN05660461_5034 [Chitinophaga ginsengisegetis]|uniref:Holin n=1 Tax=Chitinophaga ginsengisegetis TaxID=393003 RepID=A0A1T5P989_9BACT|nr:hypothetical protein [Chitinophaga ginsengisegetis]MDR6571323.1 hypothetical protein [Chitinophaga ginsengisegetis]MDR6651057.1 hypothetical protein [Chitinophaga ginsengisegetis]MDR6657416.1 hypothetical protein [Chitinophaga ginsengisegetis]SKD09153.1 hypothetical protein SAMN05660461_5034 [Chitinophaga ginsengisegetis]